MKKKIEALPNISWLRKPVFWRKKILVLKQVDNAGHIFSLSLSLSLSAFSSIPELSLKCVDVLYWALEVSNE
jgi:hypothetical protein